LAEFRHNKKHAIDSSTDHTSTITEDNLISADSNGLPKDALVASSNVKKHNFIGYIPPETDPRVPTPDDDNTKGYSVGSRWYHLDVLKIFECLNAETGAAKWALVCSDGLIFNKSGDTLTQLFVVRPNTPQGGFPTAIYAKADIHANSLAFGVIVEDILNNEKGYILSRGIINGVNSTGSQFSESWSEGDELYLSPTTSGWITKTKPASPLQTVHIGRVITAHANIGIIDIDIRLGQKITELHDVDDSDPSTGDYLKFNGTYYTPINFVDDVHGTTGSTYIEPTGFPNWTDSTMAFTDGTRTFSISPAVSTFDIYTRGVKYTKNSQEDLIISDVTGQHVIYYDTAGSLAESVNPNIATIEELIEKECFCAIIYWNTVTGASYYFGEERHGIQMDGATHAWGHFDRGTIYVSGLALGDILVDQDGSLDTHAQLSCSTGFIEDEDNFFSVPAKTAPAQIPIFYRSGAGGLWVKSTATNFPVLTTGSGRLAYNLNTGGTWSQAEITNNRYVLTHIIATNEYTPADRWVVVQGQNEYSTISAARAGAESEKNSLVLGGLPSPEMLFVGTIIYQTSNSYTNAVKGRIRSTDAGDDYVDWRIQRGEPSGGGGINALVEDPSPQLGGNLDANSFTITGLDSSTTAKGVVELATASETDTGTDATRAVTPDGLAGSIHGTKVISIAPFQSDTAVEVGNGLVAIPITAEWNGFDVVDVTAFVHDKGVTGTTDVQIRRRRAGADVDILSTKVTIGDEWYVSDGVINTSNDDLQTGDVLYVDVDAIHSGTAPNGLTVAISIRKP
jgi:hypothetical protein